jgi:hypothetical protein
MTRIEIKHRPPSVVEGGLFVMSGKEDPLRFNSFGSN